MNGVDIMDLKNSWLKIRSQKQVSLLFKACFFDLIDVTHVNSDIVYMKLGDDIALAEFQNCCRKSFD